MNVRNWKTTLSRSAPAVLVAATLAACGPREPTTDAERLARGRELVQQMSARLAAATAVSVTTTEVRDVVRAVGQEGDGVADRRVHHATPGSFSRQGDRRRGARVLVQRQGADHRRRTRTKCSRRRRCPRPSTARSTRWPSATTWRCRWATCSTAPRKRRCSPTRPPAATSAPRTSATRPATTWRFRTSASTGNCGCRCRASRCRSDSRSCRSGARVSRWST